MVIALMTLWVSAAIAVGWFARAGRDPKEIDSWANAYGVELTPANRPMVTYYVRLAVVLRVIGGVAGVGLGKLFDEAMGLATSTGLGFWIWVILGWLLGATWAEYRLTRPGTTANVASLTPRAVDDYLSPWFHYAPAVTAALTVSLAVVGLVVPEPTEPRAAAASTPGLLAAMVGVVVIAASVTLAVRAVVARRQPASDVSIVAADDAIRSSAVHHLAGGGTAAVLLVATQVAFAVLEPRALPFGVRGWVPGVLFVAAVFSWRFFAYRGWRVRRPASTVSTTAVTSA
jgi:hypothetical protein